MTQTKLGNDRVDRSDLHSRSAACIPEFCSGDMILSGRLNQRQRSEPLDDLRAGFRARESLKKLLQDEACRHDDIRTEQCFLQVLNCRFRRLGIPAKGQRPNAGIDEQCHERERSAL